MEPSITSPALAAAINYINLGLSVIAVDRYKQPLVKWTEFQTRAPRIYQVEKMFRLPGASGVAVICGQVSGNLEVIDIDCKNALISSLFEQYWDKIKTSSPVVADSLVVAATKNGGYHLYYQSPVADRNKPLARRNTTPVELAGNPDQVLKVLIETRAHKGYVIAPPSIGYKFLQHDLYNLPFISSKDRELLHSLAAGFNTLMQTVTRKKGASLQYVDSPLDDFDLRGDILELLKKHNWTIVEDYGDITLVKRPGNSLSYSSGNFNHVTNRFSVFSTSTVFAAETPYKPSAVFAILECNGDFHEATRRLLMLGFGKARLARYKPFNLQKGRSK
ncbi:bifunctional DNA primase/polymerase [[Flexibacter] sp. ATCC 35208]|uniref:bifunctional DNA primase/polymerase n=1 Tax=[Flexibacter] sp. ATCC 35208 TaxID=1936242 RepID=UPI0009D4C33A|nr:bifunctional DNA primase/polymerase [[Flexibacter] sp. ATCC 35208]OMP80099.1 hypothetical protein BW716_06295 [[Flexibacter] sp. ATCC 35208]